MEKNNESKTKNVPGITPFSSLFEKLPKWFNIILGMSGILYILGYISWAIYAIKYHLGILPVLKEQYLTAGFIPTLIIYIVSIIIYHSKNRLGNSSIISWKTISHHYVFISLVLFIIILFFRYGMDWINNLEMNIGFVIIFIINFAYLILGNYSNKFDNIFISIISYSSTVTTGLMILTFYVLIIFPKLPPELGGAKPYSNSN